MLGTMRRFAGRSIRRLGLLPGGMADGLGEDDALHDTILATKAVVFFPDPPENLYQLRQWLDAIEALDEAMGVTIIAQDSRSARALRDDTDIDVIVAAHTKTVGALLSTGAVRIVLYVGQANANAVALRSTAVVHVFLNHGDSDKYVSVSNQVKAYDVVIVAGQAAIDRHDAVMLFDGPARLRVVGRPQLPAREPGEGDLTVLYCPTWEGTLAINAYSSVKGYGAELVSALIADTGIHLIYRPHPRTGASDRTYREADLHIRSLIETQGRGEIDLEMNGATSMQRAHVLISDVSAVAADWLGQRKPLISTAPASSAARIAAPGRIFAMTPHIDASSAARAARIVRETIEDPATLGTIDDLYEYYLGGVDGPGALLRFLEVCEDSVATCDRERARIGGTA